MEKKIIWSEVYNNSPLAKEIGQEVISKVLEKGKVYTHDGVYHADEVFSTALLKVVIGDIAFDVIRTRDLSKDYFTFDVGGGEFDHHQCDEYRNGADGIFASFGKLWCTVGRTIEGLREEAWREIDEAFVKPIDLTDNTGVMNPVNFYINATKANGGVGDENFNAAVDMAYKMLLSIIQAGIKRSEELDSFEAEVEAAEIKEGILVLSKHYNVGKEAYKKYGVSWVIFPDLGGINMNIQAVGDEKLPESKRGLGKGGDIIFTHKGGWLGKAKSISAALSLLEE